MGRICICTSIFNCFNEFSQGKITYNFFKGSKKQTRSNSQNSHTHIYTKSIKLDYYTLSLDKSANILKSSNFTKILLIINR